MRAENIITDPIKTTYKIGVYGALGLMGASLAAFIAWSFSCLGGACVELLARVI